MSENHVSALSESAVENTIAELHQKFGGEASIAMRATWVARVSVLSVLVGAALFVAVFVVNWLGFQKELLRGRETLIEVHDTVSEIRLRYERLTMSANMAAASGGIQWIKRYDEDFELLRVAVTRALELASPESADKFLTQTAAAINKIVPLEKRAMQQVLDGNLERARIILGSDTRDTQTQIINNGLIELNDELVAGITADHNEAVSRHDLIMVGMGIAAVIAGFLLWRGLLSALKKSERASLVAEKKIQRLATRDSLTGVSNRGTFESYLEI